MRNLIHTGLLSAHRRLPYISDNEEVGTSTNLIKQYLSFSFGNHRTHINYISYVCARVCAEECAFTLFLDVVFDYKCLAESRNPAYYTAQLFKSKV